MASVVEELAERFVCARCGERGAQVEKLAMSGVGLSRLLEIQQHRYAFASCRNCGGFLEVLFLD
jgi:predicted nucleic-acid-binding Zn-ribbon protein